VVDLEIFNAAGRQVGQRVYTAQSLGSGQAAGYTWAFVAPAQTGQYTVKVGVFGASWSPLYSWTNGATSFVVTGSRIARLGQTDATSPQSGAAVAAAHVTVPHAPADVASSHISFAQRTTIAAQSVAPKRGATLRTTVVNKGATLRRGVIDLEVYSAAGKRVSQQAFTAQTIKSGHSASYTWAFIAPAQAGRYTMKVGVFATSWSRLFYWTSQAAHISVR
jgi:hypothetical protein